MGGLDQGPAMPRLFRRRERVTPRRIGLFAGSPATRADLLVDAGTRGRRTGREGIIRFRHDILLDPVGYVAYDITNSSKQRPRKKAPDGRYEFVF
jgi:hypothetical protein